MSLSIASTERKRKRPEDLLNGSPDTVEAQMEKKRQKKDRKERMRSRKEEQAEDDMSEIENSKVVVSVDPLRKALPPAVNEPEEDRMLNGIATGVEYDQAADSMSKEERSRGKEEKRQRKDEKMKKKEGKGERKAAENEVSGAITPPEASVSPADTPKKAKMSLKERKKLLGTGKEKATGIETTKVAPSTSKIPDMEVDNFTERSSPVPNYTNSGVLVSEQIIEPQTVARGQSWTLLDSCGGRLIECPPLLSKDEKYLICATGSAVMIYEAKDSSLRQTFKVKERDLLCAFTLSCLDPNVVWIGTRNGWIYRWDFLSTTEPQSWRTTIHIQGLKVAEEGESETLYVLEQGTRFDLFALTLVPGAEASPISILRKAAPIRDFKVINNGNVVVAISMTGFLVGVRKGAVSKSGGRNYVWRSVECSEGPICLAIKARELPSQGIKARFGVDVAVGGVRGAIFVFSDILLQLDRCEEPPSNEETPSRLNSQTLHWHREAVETVAWSLDGRYLLSGGKETTLVLWQLDTGKCQFLPNLESPIMDLTVSPTGSSYIVRLADNSVMVLSTSELAPTTHIPGIQSISFSRAVKPMPLMPTVDLLSSLGDDIPTNTAAAVINPVDGNHLLVTVPATQTGSTVNYPPAPYLQDINLSAITSSTRQALTRTNAINVNLGPEGNGILEPNVSFIQVSRDGRWMATVDEWFIPAKDASRFAIDDGIESASNSVKLEVKLRIWLWSAEEKMWSLNSRIDEPHCYNDVPGCVRVLGLVADPVDSKFATVGADSVVRTWAPKTKLKNGKTIRGQGLDLKSTSLRGSETWWAVEHSISLDQPVSCESLQATAPDRAVLAYANDGSVLAACTHHDTFDAPSPVISFIDTIHGTLHESRNGLFESCDGIHSMAFLDKYLICLGRLTATVWSVTDFSQTALITIPMPERKYWCFLGMESSGGKREIADPNSLSRVPIPHLAVNLQTGTFAIASAEIAKRFVSSSFQSMLKFRTMMKIYAPESGADPQFEVELPHATMALLSKGGSAGLDTNAEDQDVLSRKGYVVLDMGGEVHTITVAHAGSKALAPMLFEVPTDKTTLNQAGGTNGVVVSNAEDDDEEREDDYEDKGRNKSIDEVPQMVVRSEDTRPVVRREQLAEVFDHPPHAMPPLKDMFESLLRLYAGKPKKEDGATMDVDMDAAQQQQKPFVNGVARHENADGQISGNDSSEEDEDDDEDGSEL